MASLGKSCKLIDRGKLQVQGRGRTKLKEGGVLSIMYHLLLCLLAIPSSCNLREYRATFDKRKKKCGRNPRIPGTDLNTGTPGSPFVYGPLFLPMVQVFQFSSRSVRVNDGESKKQGRTVDTGTTVRARKSFFPSSRNWLARR